MVKSRRPHVPIEERRRELTETAARVMARDGAWALTTRAVAKEAGVPHGSVHYAFSSKDELMRSAVELDITHLSNLMQARHDLPVHGAEDVATAVTELFTAYADSVMANPEMEIAYFELSLMAARVEHLRDLVVQAQGEYRQTVVALLSDLAERAGMRWETDVALIAEQALTMLYGAAITWLEQRDDDLFRAVLEDAASMIGRRLV